ncbi:hypothetical protein DMN91_004354 [Ooceraea biroi]|uniref:Uncharacterized protein n=1 Tax=Ooceraea biroi TaxID=2015173 RepID=A0A3L8DUR7_OOCBI|nr:hypothetical protein DMN91_004354 [Ooceraea biroi]
MERTPPAQKKMQPATKAALENATLERLQEEAIRFKIPISEDREALIKAIRAHLDKCGPTNLLEEGQAAGGHHPRPGGRRGSAPTSNVLLVDALQGALTQMSAAFEQQQRSIMEQQRKFIEGQQALMSQMMTQWSLQTSTSGNVRVDGAEIESDLVNERCAARDRASQATDLVRKYNKIYHDNRFKKPSIYEEGNYLLIRDTRVNPGESFKLKAKYKGPYVIAKCLGNNRYVVKDIPGFNITARPYNSILSSDKLKPWMKEICPPASN